MKTFFALHGQVETADFGLQTEKVVGALVEAGWTVAVVQTPLIAALGDSPSGMFEIAMISSISRSKNIMIGYRRLGKIVVFDQGVSAVEMTAKAWLDQIYTNR